MIIIWPIFAALALGTQSGSPVLTLDEAIQLAEKSAFSLKTADSKVRKSDAVAGQVAGILGPSLTASGGYSRIHADYSASSFQFTPNDYNSETVGLTISQIIDISGTTHKSISSARDLAKAQRESKKGELLAVRSTVRTKFFAVLQADENVKIQTDALKANQDRLDKAQAKFKEGAIPRFDVLRFDTQVKQSEQDLIDAQTALTQAKQDLNNTLNRPIETDFVAAPATGDPEIPLTAEAYVAKALSTRPDLRQQELTVSALHKTADAATSGNKPTLVLSATQTAYLDPFPGGTKNQTVGSATITWPLYDGAQTAAKVKAAKEDEEQAKIGLDQLRLGAALEVRTAFVQATAQKKALVAASANTDLAKEALRLAQLRLDEGAGTTLDVISAQADLTRARSGLAVALYKYRTALSSLQKAIGSDDLATPAPTNR